MAQSGWSIRTNRLSLTAAVVASILVHGFIFCSFFFHTNDVVEPGFGVVDVEMNYSAARPQSSAKSASSKSNKETPPKAVESSQNANSSNADTNSASGLSGTRISKWPKVLREQKVAYPAQAKLNGIQGAVTLKITIDEKGIPQDIEIVDGPGHGLNEAAVTALKGFLFSPAYIGDTPTPVRITYKYKFQIQ